MNKITKTFSIIAMLFLAMFTVVLNVNAQPEELPIYVSDVEANGVPLDSWNDNRIVFERGSDLEVRLLVQRNTLPDWYCQIYPEECVDNNKVLQDVQVEVELTGTKDKVEDSTNPFDMQPNSSVPKTLKLKLPDRMEDKSYQLRVIVTTPNSYTYTSEYSLLIEAPQNEVAIKEIIVSPNDKILAGRALTADARLKNYGQEDEEDVKVVFAIPSLGVQETTYVNEIEKDESVSTDDVLLRIPANTKSGSYDLEVTAYYNDGDDKVKSTTSVNVVSDEQAAQAVTPSAGSSVTGNTYVTAGVQSQTLARGENGVIYPLTIANSANAAKTYILTISGAQDWATTTVTPSNVVVLNAGETKQVYVYVAANENSAVGEHVFSVDVKEGSDVKQIPLKASVLESAGSNFSGVKNALVVAVVLLVVLIVVLGGVVLYQRGKKPGNKEDEQIAQTYY